MSQPTALWFSALTRSTSADEVRGRALVSGWGCHVTDARGREYLDARSALWNASLGYDNRAVTEAVARQLAALPVAQSVRHDQPAEITLRYAE
ncbi:aminotransferase class III-fold pyridoxal phosphate-dependent enzyme, partial [Actinosynnema sp. NPDC023658]|uniref:aminotransferase class III-fold pyridoxal phosphate-dependent enzyme n=1 Tax=Actinosynnema sp. NPDC023658 TaxID=3155465 RepID=UPI0033FC361F